MTSVRETYATVEKTGLTQLEYDGLAWFVDEVDAGRIKDVDPDASLIDNIESGHLPDFFCMSAAAVATTCGTAGCIWGYVRSNFAIGSFVSSSGAARKIFLPTEGILASAKVSEAREATVKALRGQEPWPRHEFA